jgi:hypothetical protein
MTKDWTNPDAYYSPECTLLSPNCQWAELGEERINFVELLAFDRNTLDAWITLSEDIRRDWDNSKPILACMDVSKTTFSFSPYFMKRGAQMMQVNPNARTYVAMVFSESFLINMFKSLLARSETRNSSIRVFSERKQAIDWLRKVYATQVNFTKSW